MKKSIMTFLFICLVLLKTQAFALENNRDIFGVFIETQSEAERKKSRVSSGSVGKAIHD